MTHIITEPCVGTKDTACVDVCPVDCIYGKDDDWEILYIHPEECIDCGLCIDACPTSSARCTCRGVDPHRTRGAYIVLAIQTRAVARYPQA